MPARESEPRSPPQHRPTGVPGADGPPRPAAAPRRILLANLYSANNRGDWLIALGTLELLRTVWPEAEFYGATTFRGSSWKYLAPDIEGYRALFVDLLGNPSQVILSPHEFAELSSPRLVVHYGSALLRDFSHLLVPRGRRNPSSEPGPLPIPDAFDLVAFVGGSYLQADRRFHPNLPGHLYLAYLCRRSHVKYAFLGESVSGSGKWPSKLLLKTAFAGASGLAFRDPLSLQEALGNELVSPTGPNPVWLPDMALGLANSLKKYRRVRSKRSRPTVGVAFRTWKTKDARGQPVDVVGVMARALLRVVRATSATLVLIPFSRISDSRTDDDLRACTALKNALVAASPDTDVRFCLPDPEGGLAALALAFDPLDMNICVRMHATILSAMLGIPSVTIEYEGHKSKGVCSYLGLSDYYVSLLSEENVIARTLALREDLERVSGQLIEKVDECYHSLRARIPPLLDSGALPGR